jgi:hypothetical protein
MESQLILVKISFYKSIFHFNFKSLNFVTEDPVYLVQTMTYILYKLQRLITVD